jgi:hypothetical protein
MCLRTAEGTVERIAGAATGFRNQVTIQIDRGRDGLMAEPAGNLRDRDAFGERRVANVCRRSWKVVSVGNSAALIAGFQIGLL